jgi:serine/threonine protein kinase
VIGEICGDYRLVQKLGEGGTGEVYLAEQRESGAVAAVKVLFPHLSSDKDVITRFFAEVESANQINHVGVTDVLGMGMHANGRAYLVMERIEGKTLTEALIDQGAVSDIESLADIAWQIAGVLQAAHNRNIVHGALKPDAIFLTFPAQQAPRPLLKLVDFGMRGFTSNVRHSQTGSLLGAPLYMSPEIGRGLGKIDHRTDIYSLGCILFEMACGRPPFVREGKGELIIAHNTEPAPFVSAFEPSIPQGVDQLIGRMLCKNPDARPRSMAEVAQVLEKFFDKGSAPSPAAEASPERAPSVPPFVASAAAAIPAVTSPTAIARLSPSPAAPMPAARAPAAPAPAPVPVFSVGPRPKFQAPTALLPPTSDVAVSAGSPAASGARTWAARVERTVILQAPSSVAPRPRLPRKPAEGVVRPGRSPVASTTFISLPIVIISASVLLVLATLAYVFLSGRPRASTGKTEAAPSAPAAKAALPRFQPPEENGAQSPAMERQVPVPSSAPMAASTKAPAAPKAESPSGSGSRKPGPHDKAAHKQQSSLW